MFYGQLYLPADHINENAMHSIDRFLILLYDRTSTATNIDKACRELFSKKSNIQLIPPISAALKQQVRRPCSDFMDMLWCLINYRIIIIINEQYTMVDISAVRPWFLHSTNIAITD